MLATTPKLRLSSKATWPLVLLVIAACWIGNVWYYQSVQLENTLFFEHNITINGYKSNLIELSYLENRQEKRKVIAIQLEELPSLRFQLRNQSDYKHQRIYTMVADWRPESAGVEQVPVTIREATVFYEKGHSERVPIGEIRLIWEEEQQVFETTYGGSSSDGTGFNSGIMTRAATLMSVEYSFSDKLISGFDLHVSQEGEEAVQLPLKLAPSDPLSMRYKWSIPAEAPEAYIFYEGNIVFHFLAEDGSRIRMSFPISANRYLTETQVKRYVRSGGNVS